MQNVQTHHLRPAVSQLAKTGFPTLKALPTKKNQVGRQAKKTPRTHAPTYASGEISQPQYFSLRKCVATDFLQTIPLLFDTLENTKVVFHNQAYVDALFSTYHDKDVFLILEWIKTFALMRIENRTRLINGVIQSNEDDFLKAFRLLKLQKIRKKFIPKTQNRMRELWGIIMEHFPEQIFSTRDIYQKTTMNKSYVRDLLTKLVAENKLRECKTHNYRNRKFQVVQNR